LQIHALAIGPAPGGGEYLYAGTLAGPFRAQRGAQGWQTMAWAPVNSTLSADIRQFVPVPGQAGQVYACSANGLYLSHDYGATWQHANNGLGMHAIYTILVDSAHPGTILVGTESGLYLSTDNAASWKAAGLASQYVTTLAQDPSDPLTLWAGTARGLFHSTDG